MIKFLGKVMMVAMFVSGSAAYATDDTIADIAVSNPDFSTLVTALTEADLVETLQGEGPFTVFAPTNEAFAKIPADDLAAILADKDLLTDILTYHVIDGAVSSEVAVTLSEATMLNGETISLGVCHGNLYINGNTKVTVTDIEASNGVIHVIDTVLVPEAH